MRAYLLLILLLCSKTVLSQEVPHKINFADMELKLTKEAIEDIQSDVNALTRSETYFQKKLELVDMYMPIIERIFKEEGLPDDFKYLVIQESALVSDAVSSSNAVGFWQFKEISALENDLRVDGRVDERKNIVSATRAAANYLKNHNKTFDNWAHALIAYQRGVYGAKSVINERYAGAKKMPISKNTYWYLKKYLAHKIAFENAIGTSRPTYFLLEKQDVKGRSLKDIAQEYKVSTELVEEYNKWLSRGDIPEDKNYTVIIPVTEIPLSSTKTIERKSPAENLPPYDESAIENQQILIEGVKVSKNATIAHELKVNKLKAIVAANGYTVKTLAEKGRLSEKKFRKFNDMSLNQSLEFGEIYYLQRKLNRAKYYYHTVYPGESMWSIAQKYGLKLHKLYRKNRMKDPTTPKVGRVLWLRLNRPHSVDVEFKEVPSIKKPKDNKSTTIKQEQEVIPENDKTVNPKDVEKIDSTKVVTTENLKIELEEIDSVYHLSTDGNTNSNLNAEDAVDEKEMMEDEDLELETKPSNLQEYTIKKGDTFFSIANRFNMRISELLGANNLNIQEPLKIGQIILVDYTTSEADNAPLAREDNNSSDNGRITTKKHTVEAGETLYSIARFYNVNLNDLMKWNNKDDYSINEGEIIIIHQK